MPKQVILPGGTTVTAYTDGDTQELWPLITKARDMATKDAAKTRNEGTCVKGAGLVWWRLLPRWKYPRSLLVVTVPLQGNLATQKACTRALRLLRRHGIDVTYDDGSMD